MIYIDDLQTQSADSQGTTTPENTTQPTEQTPQETPQTEQPVTQTDQDSFFDPNTVPEELKPAYKQMQAAFTKKTQEAAQLRKEAEAIREKAEAYDKYQQHIPVIEEMLKKQPSNQSPELKALEDQYRKAGYSDEAIEMMKMGIGFALNHMNQSSAAQRQSDWVNTKIEEAAKLDSRLTDSSLVYETGDGEKSTFGQIVEQLVAADANWIKDPVAATQRAIKKVDALIGKAKTEGKAELSTMAKTKVAKFPSTVSSPQSTSETDPKGSMVDIGKQVAAELGIKL